MKPGLKKLVERTFWPTGNPADTKGEVGDRITILGLPKKYSPDRNSKLLKPAQPSPKGIVTICSKPLKRTSSSQRKRILSAHTSSMRPPRIEKFFDGCQSTHASATENGGLATVPAISVSL